MTEGQGARIGGMRGSAKKVLKEALELTEKQRADLAYNLLRSLDGKKDPGVEEAWNATLAERVDELESGAVRAIPGDEVHRRIQKVLARRRRR